MNTSTKASLLTLLALLLVVGSVAIFLLQARGRLLSQNTELSDDIATLQSDVAQQSADNEALNNTLGELSFDATAVATDLTQQLATSAGEVESLTSSLAESENALAESNSALQTIEEAEAAKALRGPEITIIDQISSLPLLPFETIPLIIFINDESGIESVTIMTAEIERTFQAEGRTSFSRELSTSFSVEGSFTITVFATDIDGNEATASTNALEVFDYETRNADLRERIEANVIEIRQLEPLEPIEPTFLTATEMRERLENDLAEELIEEEVRHDVLVLSAFDFFERDFDLYNYFINLYAGSVLGFYDPESAEFVVLSSGAVLNPDSQWTYAHEFMHALADQHFDLSRISNEEWTSEARFAFRSLVEGEAELLQNLYLAGDYFTPAEEAQLSVSFGGIPSSADIIIRSLVFPYVRGTEFVTFFYNQGGWEAINELYDNPPVSSEQILHPERYIAGDVPDIVSLVPMSATLGAGWELLEEDIMGEFSIQSFLLQQMVISEADAAAEGWGGDRYAVYWNEESSELVLAWRLTWDTPEDQLEFVDAMFTYAGRQYGGEGEIQEDDSICWNSSETFCMSISDEEVLLVRAPSLAVATTINAVQR